MITLPNFSKVLFKLSSEGQNKGRWVFYPFAHRSNGYVLKEKSDRFDISFSIDSLLIFFFLSIGVIGAVFEFFYISSVLAGGFFIYFIRVRFLTMGLEVTEEPITAREVSAKIAEITPTSTLFLINMFCLGLLFWGIREATKAPLEPIYYMSSGVTLAFFLTLFSTSTFLLYAKGLTKKMAAPPKKRESF